MTKRWFGKPHAQHFEACLARMAHIPPSRVVHVGIYSLSLSLSLSLFLSQSLSQSLIHTHTLTHIRLTSTTVARQPDERESARERESERKMPTRHLHMRILHTCLGMAAIVLYRYAVYEEDLYWETIRDVRDLQNLGNSA